MWYIACGFGGICLGILLGMFFAAVGYQNKEWDAFNKGYKKAVEDMKLGGVENEKK